MCCGRAVQFRAGGGGCVGEGWAEGGWIAHLLDLGVGELGLVHVSLGGQILDRLDGALEDHAVVAAHQLLVGCLERLQAGGVKRRGRSPLATEIATILKDGEAE